MESAITQNIGIMFQKSFIPFEDLSQISDKDLAYVNQDPRLRPFYKYDTNLNEFEAVIKDKQADKTERKLLSNVLKKQYANFNVSESTAKNIKLLEDENTFTVITAHQPSLFTGPSYFIYKICSVLNLAKQLNTKFEDKHIVPIFITGGEDHDFEEISSTSIFGKKITWKNSKGGSVGKLDNGSLTDVLAELKEILGDRPIATEIYNTIETAFAKFKTYGEGMRYLVNELFESYGLVVADMSDAALKASFIPIIEKEIFDRKSINYIQATVEKLEAAGFSNQAYPREINFFYLGDGYRERIVFEDNKYSVLNQNLSFSAEEMKTEINKHPERFSPNVNMRPIFQEFVFPNLAYVGGGGELAYWIERKSQFDYYNINYPMLIRRNSVLIVDRGTAKKMDKLEINMDHLIQEEHQVVNAFLDIHSQNQLTLEKQKKSINKLFDQIVDLTKKIDGSLVATVEAEKTKQIKSLENLEGRLKKAEKNKFDVGINQVKSIREKLFPNNSLQERKENFLTFYTKYGKDYFEYLVDNLDPFEKGLILIKEEV